MTTPTPRTDAYTEECRAAIDALEERFGIELVSIEHHEIALRELAAAQERALAAEARAEASERDAQRYRKCRRNGGFFFTSDCMTDDEVDAEIDALPDHAAIAEGKR